MPRLLIACPNTGESISTGMSFASAEVLASSRLEENSTQCPSCGGTHLWEQVDGFLEGESPKPPPPARMLRAHFDAVESTLLALHSVSGAAGHPTLIGTPREFFIREFLESHVSRAVSIGTGEIIEARSRRGEKRNQIDVILYKPDYPRLKFGGETTAHLVESVIATIEVKSKLTKQSLKTAARVARRIKDLDRSVVRSFSAGYQPPSVLAYVVAYDGPKNMETVYSWLDPIHAEFGIPITDLPATANDRVKIESPSVDGIFVLGRGHVTFDNTPLTFITDEARAEFPDRKWVFTDVESGSLLWLFVTLTQAISGISASWLEPRPYLRDISVSPGFAP